MDVSDTFYNSDGWKTIVSDPYYVQFNPNVTPAIAIGDAGGRPGRLGAVADRYAYDGTAGSPRQISLPSASKRGRPTPLRRELHHGEPARRRHRRRPRSPTAAARPATSTSTTRPTRRRHRPRRAPVPERLLRLGRDHLHLHPGPAAGHHHRRGREPAGPTATTWPATRPSATDPDTGTTTSSYDAAGHLLQRDRRPQRARSATPTTPTAARPPSTTPPAAPRRRAPTRSRRGPTTPWPRAS